MENVICYKCAPKGNESVTFYKLYKEVPSDVPPTFANMDGVQVYDRIVLSTNCLRKLDFSGTLDEGCISTDKDAFELELSCKHAVECSPEEFQKAWVYVNRVQNMFISVINLLRDGGEM